MEESEKIRKVYYCNLAKQGYSLQVLEPPKPGVKDEDRKPVPKLSAQGAPLYVRSKPVYIEEEKHFTTIQAKNTVKVRALCQRVIESDDEGKFTFDQQRDIAKLEAMADDDATKVMREDAYEKATNLERYNAKQEIIKIKSEAKETTIAAVSAAVEEVKGEANKVIAELNAQLHEATSAIPDKPVDPVDEDAVRAEAEEAIKVEKQTANAEKGKIREEMEAEKNAALEEQAAKHKAEMAALKKPALPSAGNKKAGKKRR